VVSHGPDADQRFVVLWSSPTPALCGWKMLQSGITSKAIDTTVILGAVKKTAAPFAHLQLHAQIHHDFSVIACNPGIFVFD
jgi:hypothetical protein